jgi:Nucleotidyltransferase of unknown function (DUF6036)
MRSPVGELLADLAAALEGAGAAWYLFGAQAAILHGAARLSADVDVTVRLPDGMSNEDLTRQIEGHNFQPRVGDPLFIERTRVIPFIHVPTAMPVDVVLAGPGIEDQFFARALVREVEEVRIRLASPEDLIVMKVLAGRPKDLEDVESIVAAYAGRLEVDYIERTLDLLERALSQSDLLPEWRRIARHRPVP